MKESVTAFITQKLKLKVNEEKSAVDRLWNRSFLGYTVLPGKSCRLRVAPESVKRLAGVKITFQRLDQWIRRRLRCILWRQWKRTATRARHMNYAYPKRFFDRLGLFSLLDMLRLHSGRSRTAAYGTVRAVV